MIELQDKLIQELEFLIAHLNQYNEENWSAQLSRIKELIDNGQILGLNNLIGIYGGMGSFNDLILSGNGNENEKDEEDFDNKEFNKLSNAVYKTAVQLNREINKNWA